MQISGTIEKYLKRNIYSGKTYFLIQSTENIAYRTSGGNIKCSGVIPEYHVGMPLILNGEFKNSTFMVDSFEEVCPDEQTAISILSNHLVKGIGVSLAKSIVKCTGTDIFDFATKQNAVERLGRIPRITNQMAKEIVRKLNMVTNFRQLYQFIAKYGGSYIQAKKIEHFYGPDALNKIKQNPYGKMLFYCGFSIEKCDEIAFDLGIGQTADVRLKSLFSYALFRLQLSGNTCATLEEIKSAIHYLIKNSVYHEDLCIELFFGYLPQSICAENRNGKLWIYQKKLYQQEISIQINLMRLQNSAASFPVSDKQIEMLEQKSGFAFAKEQKDALKLLKNGGINIITGGPGTGKTTVISGLIDLFQMNSSESIILCAPTGRAAGRMMELTGRHASTIHRTLEFMPYGDSFECKNQKNPIDAGLIIVDELSMVDTELLQLLLGAIKNQTTVIFVGDVRQLQSVGAGNVLQDLIQSNIIPVIELKSIFRQDEKSVLFENNKKIRNYETTLNTNSYFQVIPVDNKEDLRRLTVEIACDYYNTEDLFDFQVLSQTRVDYCGTGALNKEIQKNVNQSATGIYFGDTEFKIGDKIMMIRNNYELQYFNGDLGEIINIGQNEIELLINGMHILLPQNLYDEMELAYATTIHKSQGSEYKTVLISLADSPSIMLVNNLILTAVSRAKERVIIINENHALETAIKTKYKNQRETGLVDKLKGIQYDIVF